MVTLAAAGVNGTKREPRSLFNAQAVELCADRTVASDQPAPAIYRLSDDRQLAGRDLGVVIFERDPAICVGKSIGRFCQTGARKPLETLD
jgi:hypothetical protein